jgi:hypothetical protein
LIRLFCYFRFEHKNLVDSYMKITVLLAIVFSFMFNSCQKHHDIVSTASKIKQLSIIFTGNPPDPSQVDFYYDNLSRVSKIFMYLGDSGIVVPSADTICLMDFNYQGNNELPSSVFINLKLFHVKYSHTLSYGVDNRLIKDSVVNIADTISTNYIVSYSYPNNKTIANSTFLVPSTKDTLISENGNFTSFFQPFGVSSYEYDNKINPLNTLNIAPIFHVICNNREPSNPYWSLWTLCNKNNLTKVTFSQNGLIRSEHFLAYSYNTQNLPTKRLWYYGNSVSDTLYYKYQ